MCKKKGKILGWMKMKENCKKNRRMGRTERKTSEMKRKENI
jgi:hypothetical protein